MQRSRTRQELGPFGTHVHVSSGTSNLGSHTHRLTQTDYSMTDVVVKDFRKRLSKGEVINNPCTKLKTSVYRSGGGTYHTVKDSNPAVWGNISGSGSLTAFIRAKVLNAPLLSVNLPVNDAEQAAKASALASIDKAPYAMAEDIATIRETVKFIRRPWASIEDLAVHYFRARKSLRFVQKRGSTLSRTPKALTELWLEYRFAFSPLVQTITNAFVSLSETSSRRYDTVHTAHGTVELEKSNSDTYINGINHFKRGVVTKKTVRAVVQYRVQPPLREWQYKYGLRAKDIPETMWDLFPLSFMYDRILNIGDAVRGLTNFLDPSIVILGGTVSRKTETVQDISYVKQVSPGWTVTISPDTDFFFTEEYVRGVWQPSVLNVVPPVLPGGLVKDLTSIADLAALLAQRLRKGS